MVATAVRPLSVPRQRDAVLVTGDTLDAITMPASFGALVQTELEIMMLAGSVIAHEDGSWTFLTQRATTPHRTIPADLLPLGVRSVPAGSGIRVPAGLPHGELDRDPAIWSVVIGAARRVAYRRASRAS